MVTLARTNNLLPIYWQIFNFDNIQQLLTFVAAAMVSARNRLIF
jgi:hypothetical protein